MKFQKTRQSLDLQGNQSLNLIWIKDWPFEPVDMIYLQYMDFQKNSDA